jgi:hypothetical protein
MFSDYFDMLMLKIIKKKQKKNIILMCFGMKITLKSNRYHTPKHPKPNLCPWLHGVV